MTNKALDVRDMANLISQPKDRHLIGIAIESRSATAGTRSTLTRRPRDKQLRSLRCLAGIHFGTSECMLQIGATDIAMS